MGDHDDRHPEPREPAAFTRREFLHTGLAFASASLVVPQFLQASALGMPRPAPGLSSIPGVDENRILVVVQLSGGNDGLNTVVPFRDDAYYRARPGIALRGEGVQALSRTGVSGTEGVGLHRALEPVRGLYDEGLCSIVQGVGYPNPNRSHFKSMDIWQTADLTGTGDGWLGRYIDSECCGYGKGESGTPEGARAAGAEPPIAIGRRAPLALSGRRVQPIAFETARLFRWTGEDVHGALADPYERLIGEPGEGASPNAEFLTRTALDARVASETIRRATDARPLAAYPRSGLGQQLAMVAGMIRAGMPTRVYYVSLGGFDTHAGQGGANGRHANLLGQFAGAVRAFYRDLKLQGNDTRVLTMSFSEFGRRVGQNASGGTDHGTAAPMFLFGPMARAGVVGRHPSLSDLEDGDVKYGIDFRSVYASIVDRWLQGDSRAVLGAQFRHAEVLSV